MLFYVVTLLVSVASLVAVSAEYDSVIYVDPEYGRVDNSCWTGGADVPCKTVDLALEGARRVSTGIFPVVLVQPKCPTAAQCSCSNVTSGSSLQPSNSSSESCPTWQYRNKSGVCVCGSGVHGAVECNSALAKTTVLDCHCMTYNKDHNVVLGKCFFGCYRSNSGKDLIRYPVPSDVSELNYEVCGNYSRTGQSCGNCIEGYTPLAYSYELRCMNCTGSAVSNWMKYLTAAFLPLTGFYIIVIVFKISATAPQLYGFVTYCQAMSTPVVVRSVLAEVAFRPALFDCVKLFFTVMGIWNLDFFRAILPDMCLDLNSLQLSMLEYAVSFYPLLLVLISYSMIELHDRGFKVVVLLWKPFGKLFSYVRSDWDIRNSIIHSFATFLLLSYMRILSVSFDVLAPIKIYSVTGGTVGWFLYSNSSVLFFGKEHLPYGIVALTVAVFCSIFPALLMILYPMVCFQRLLNCLRLRTQALHTFMDCFQGYYKDRTDSTHDCRYFAGIYLLARFCVYITYGLSFDVFSFAIATVLYILLSLLVIIVKPYKTHLSVYNTVDACIILCFSMWLASVLAINIAQLKDYHFITSSYWLSCAIVLFPLVYISLLSVFWIFKESRCGKMVYLKLCVRIGMTSYLEEQCENLPYRIDNPKLGTNYGTIQ